jgi:hypothetical protein
VLSLLEQNDAYKMHDDVCFLCVDNIRVKNASASLRALHPSKRWLRLSR